MKPLKFVVPVLAIVALGACSKKPQPASTPQPASGAQANDGDATRRAPDNREAEEARRRAELARAHSILANIVYFDFDSFDIRDDSKRALDEKVPVLRNDPAFSLLIAGHADERGSTEYNLALGMRRANAVRDYLTGFGIEPRRLDVTSFGEEQPVDPGQSESSYAKNRRAEFQPTRR